MVVNLAVQNTLVFKEISLEVVGIVRLVRIESNGIVCLLKFDEHVKSGKN